MLNNKVSIIIPAYNCEDYIAETLDSVLVQTHQCWECIIVNDGSTDSTKDIALSFCTKDPRFHYYSQGNQGPAAARNFAIRNSSGEFILPLDADDTISDSYIEKAASYLTEHPETALVYAKGDFFGEENSVWELPAFDYERFIWNNCICSCAMYRRSDFDKTNGYNPNMKYGDEDWDFWLSLLNKDSIVHRIDETLFHYRIRTDSRTTRTLTPNIEKSKRQIYENHKEIYNPYLCDIVLIHERYSTLQQQLDEEKLRFIAIHRSWAYRLGKMILKPFTLLRGKRN